MATDQPLRAILVASKQSKTSTAPILLFETLELEEILFSLSSPSSNTSEEPAHPDLRLNNPEGQRLVL